MNSQNLFPVLYVLWFFIFRFWSSTLCVPYIHVYVLRSINALQLVHSIFMIFCFFFPNLHKHLCTRRSKTLQLQWTKIAARRKKKNWGVHSTEMCLTFSFAHRIHWSIYNSIYRSKLNWKKNTITTTTTTTNSNTQTNSTQTHTYKPYMNSTFNHAFHPF